MSCGGAGCAGRGVCVCGGGGVKSVCLLDPFIESIEACNCSQSIHMSVKHTRFENYHQPPYGYIPWDESM